MMTQIKPDQKSTNSSAAAALVCGHCHCHVEDRRLLLHVRYRSTFLRLCTGCVLRLHPQHFCPTCFQVYPPPPLPNDAVRSCSKCYSITHPQCAPTPTLAPNSYICPLCLHPDKPLFKLKSLEEANLDRIDNCAVMDADAARKYFTAVRIASNTMNIAAAAARVEAEKRAKDAATTRKRAREALEHVFRLMVKEKMRKKDDLSAGPTLVGCGGGGVKMEREYNVNVGGGNNRSGIVTSMVVDKGDNSNGVLAALNKVELRDNNEEIMMGNGDENVGDLDEERDNDSGGDDHLNFVDMESGDIEDENLEVLVQQPLVDNGVQPND